MIQINLFLFLKDDFYLKGTTARAVSGQFQESGTPSGSITWVIGIQGCGLSPATLPGTQKGTRVAVEQPGLEPKL